MIKKDILNKVYKKRKKDAHKHDFGMLLVIGGNNVFHGPPLYNSLAAYRSGVDLVFTVCPERSADLVGSYGPDLITYPLDGKFIQTKHVKKLSKISKKADAIVLGGGLILAGLVNDKKTKKAIRKFLENTKKPCVLDAGALKSINKDDIKENFLLTPHSKEFEFLSNKKANKKNAKEFAKENNCTIILKGHTDIITNGKKTKENKTGTAFMTKGGTGDILAGIAGSLLAQGNDIFSSACASTYIAGKAGEYASKKYGQGLLASDLIQEIPKVIKND